MINAILILRYILVLQKAGTHMEHTMVGSYIVLLLGHVVMDCDENEVKVRNMLPHSSFQDMLIVLKKYFSFLNLTASVSIVNFKFVYKYKRYFWLDAFSGRSCDSGPRESDRESHQVYGRLRQEAGLELRRLQRLQQCSLQRRQSHDGQKPVVCRLFEYGRLDQFQHVRERLHVRVGQDVQLHGDGHQFQLIRPVVFGIVSN